MNVFRLTQFLLVGLLTLLALAPASSAFAAPPEIQTYSIDETFTHPILTEGCGFQVDVHIEGREKFRTFLDENGNPVRELITLNYTVTLTANGTFVTWHPAGSVLVVFNEDNSVTIIEAGLRRLVTVPGEGQVANVGRIITKLSFDEEGNLIDREVLFQAGPSDAPLAICAALE